MCLKDRRKKLSNTKTSKNYKVTGGTTDPKNTQCLLHNNHVYLSKVMHDNKKNMGEKKGLTALSSPFHSPPKKSTP